MKRQCTKYIKVIKETKNKTQDEIEQRYKNVNRLAKTLASLIKTLKGLNKKTQLKACFTKWKAVLRKLLRIQNKEERTQLLQKEDRMTKLIYI